jgi:ABC-type multidrug transport system ATPase subunit
MTALMGATGAGKTTLMDVLAGRKTGGRMDGEIYVNGALKDSRSFSRIAAYCEQMDIHSETTTVREALLFSARLRQPYNVPDEVKVSFVNEIIAMLELGPIEGKVVGELGKGGLTVEQRKRLTIGVELVANPSILFLDEPTSGLDALAATMVMKVIRRIASSGRTVVCTIHQPSLAIFESFDNLLLLKMGGRVAYFGSLGEGSSDLIDYFVAVPGTPQCPEHANPATYMLDVIGAGVGREKSGTTTDYAAVYHGSEHKRRMESELQGILDASGYAKTQENSLSTASFASTGTPITFQLRLTIERAAKGYWRTPRYTLVRLVLFPIFGLFFGSVFWQIKIDSPSAINSAVALNYMIMDFIGVFNLMTVIEITCAERAVYYRERAANMYSSFSYQVALFLAELPYLIVNTVIFVTIMYWMVGFSTLSGDFLWYIWIYFLYGGLATYVGQLCCQLLPNEKVANIAVGAITIIYNIFSGFLLPVNQMKSWYKWITYIAPSSQAFSALSASQFAQCRDETGDDFGCRTIKSGNKTITIENFVGDNFGFDADNIYRNMSVMMLEWVTTFVICYLALKFIKHIVR